jgi:CheY-like chemotaxis protein
MHVLIVEDNPKDQNVATGVVNSIGILSVGSTSHASTAAQYLEAAADGQQLMPDIIILDLDLGYESGHELMRFCYRDPKFSGIKLVVWTAMEQQKEICELFGVSAVVIKSEGVGALRSVITSLAS